MSEEKKPEEQQQGNRRRWRIRLDGLKAEWPISGGLMLAGTGVIAAAIVVVIYLVVRPGSASGQVEVPNLVGMPRAAAEAQLGQLGLKLHATYDQASDKPAGTVLQTDPAAGTKLGYGHGVSLVLASGAPETTPTTPGPTETTVIRPGGNTPTPGPGPAPGPITRGQTPAPAPNPNQAARQVPEVTGLEIAAAKRKLSDGNLTVGSTTREESDRPAGTVLRTNPAAGTAVNTGTPVDLVIAKPSPVLLGVGRVDQDPAYPDCATGYRSAFSRQISVTEPTRVTYQWQRSDGAGAPVEYVDFSAPGTKTVTDSWQRWGKPGETLTGWKQIIILTPRNLTGQRLTFSHTCPNAPG